VLEDTYPVRWTGRQAVVTLPEHIEVANAGPIGEELLSVINRGAAALIADMTATLSCDHSGADAVVRAYQRALVSGTQLRLVVTAPAVRRVLSVNGLDRLISIYPSLDAAIAAGAPAAAAGGQESPPPRAPPANAP
jgi:anti-sigma B factor antagonist